MSRSIWKGPFTDLIKLKFTIPEKEHTTYQKSISLKKEGGTKQQFAEHSIATHATQGMQKILKRVKIWSRRSQIMPLNVGKEFLVHNGHHFVAVKCIEPMCSHKWGEFAVTRKKPAHKFNKKRQLHKPMYKRG